MNLIGRETMHNFYRMLMLGIFLLIGNPALAVQAENSVEAVSPAVNKAVMCESVQDGLPVNRTIIFNVSNTAAYCWCEFDPVQKDGLVFHEWYRKDVLITRKKLAVHTPRWATYSRLPLREADIGPWRLDITDEGGNVLKTLRFSVTE